MSEDFETRMYPLPSALFDLFEQGRDQLESRALAVSNRVQLIPTEITPELQNQTGTLASAVSSSLGRHLPALKPFVDLNLDSLHSGNNEHVISVRVPGIREIRALYNRVPVDLQVPAYTRTIETWKQTCWITPGTAPWAVVRGESRTDWRYTETIQEALYLATQM